MDSRDLPKNVNLKGSKNSKISSEEASAGKLSVNLLPPEILFERRQGSKLAVINKLSILALLLMLFFTSATLSLRISQNSELKEIRESVAVAEAKVSGMKGKEEQLAVLKSRLNSIKTLNEGDVKRKAIFSLVVFLIPESMGVSEVAVDGSGKMTLSLTSSSLASIESLISNLGNKEKNSNLISKVTLDGLSMGKEETYRFSLKIIPR